MNKTYLIPFQPYPEFTERVTLEDTLYTLRFAWNARGEFWTVDFMDKDENPLVVGIKIVEQYEVISKFKDRGLPPGRLFITNITDSMDKLTYDDYINGNAVIVYEESV